MNKKSSHPTKILKFPHYISLAVPLFETYQSYNMKNVQNEIQSFKVSSKKLTVNIVIFGKKTNYNMNNFKFTVRDIRTDNS